MLRGTEDAGGAEVNQRKIQALRSLAERPGTEAEGIVAIETLKRLNISHVKSPVLENTTRFEIQYIHVMAPLCPFIFILLFITQTGSRWRGAFLLLPLVLILASTWNLKSDGKGTLLYVRCGCVLCLVIVSTLLISISG